MAALSEGRSGFTETVAPPAEPAPPPGSRRALVQTVGLTPRFRARVYRDRGECEATWRRLESEGVCTGFQTALWTDSVCTFLADERATPFFVEVVNEARGASVMLLPLVLRRRFGVRTVGWLNFEVCDYAAPVMARDVEWSAEAAAAAWTAILAALPATDVIDIAHIPRKFADAANPLALLPQRRLMDLKAFGVPLNRRPDQSGLQSMGGKPLRELHRRRRRLEDEGLVEFVEATSRAQVDELFDTMVEQRRERFERLGRFDLLSRPSAAAFYRRALARSLCDKGPARMFGVRVNGEWISTAYVLVHGGTLYGVIMSMGDEKWTRHGPGILIVTELMKWSQQQGHRYFDMTIGDMPYKNDIGPEQHDLFRILQAETLVGRWAIQALNAANLISSTLHRQPRLFEAMRGVRQAFRRLNRRLRSSR